MFFQTLKNECCSRKSEGLCCVVYTLNEYLCVLVNVTAANGEDVVLCVIFIVSVVEDNLYNSV